MKVFKKLFKNFEANIITFTVLMLLLFSILVSVIGYGSFTKAFELEYDVTTYHMGDTATALVDGDQIDDYLANGADDDSYKKTKNALDIYCLKMDVSLIYVIQVDTSDYNHFVSVFNCVGKNTPYTEWELGSVHETTNDEYRETYRQLYDGTLAYGTIYRTDNLKGAPPHITTLVPLKDSDGKTVAVLCVQRMMDRMVEARRPFLYIIAGSAAGLMLVSSIISAVYMRRQFVKPINKIIREAKRFANENKPGEKLGADISYIEELSVLATSIDKMEDDMLKYIDNLTVATADKERILTELSLATAIQANSLPNTFPAFPDRSDFEIYASMTPAKAVGGDFYDFFLIDDDHLAVVIADVSGKGIPAALFMMVTKILINEISQHNDATPAEVLQLVNERVCPRNVEDMFVTVWLGFIELSTVKVISANAGHDDPAVMRKDGKFKLLKSRHGFVIGAMESVKYHNFEFTLGRGDKLFLYTDGIPEATDIDNNMMSIDGMLKALNQYNEESPQGIIDGVIRSVNEFVGDAPQFDDMTTVCLEMKGEEVFRLVVDADRSEMETVNEFVHQHLSDTPCSFKTMMDLDLAVEEIFVNIANYAYGEERGKAEIILSKNNDFVSLTFVDQGIPYDPLAKPDPDTTLSASERQIGGLGIFLVKKMMDDTSYEYKDGSNRFTMVKKFT